MAKIFCGELVNIDKEVVERLRSELPDDFTVLAEVNVGRNIDLVVIRPNADGPAVLIAAELKHVSRPLTGQTDGVWKELTDGGGWSVIEPSNNNDLNFYWQSVHSANALKRWLWLNQRIFRDDAAALDENRFAVWPDLVLLGDPTIPHRLPIAPANRYGQWYFGVDDWMRHLVAWNPRKGVPLHQREVNRLVEAMGLLEVLAPDAMPLVAVDVPGVELDPDMHDLQRRVLALESMLAGDMRPVSAITRASYVPERAARAS
jgi:hypothetical protein